MSEEDRLASKQLEELSGEVRARREPLAKLEQELAEKNKPQKGETTH